MRTVVNCKNQYMMKQSMHDCNLSVSNLEMSLYKNQCIINNMMQHSFEDNAGIRQLTRVLKIVNTCTSLVPVVQPWFHSDTFSSF